MEIDPNAMLAKYTYLYASANAIWPALMTESYRT